jgi:hypothetical protein
MVLPSHQPNFGFLKDCVPARFFLKKKTGRKLLVWTIEEENALLQIGFYIMVYRCTKSKRNHVLCVLRMLHVLRVLRVLPETGGEQKLVLWSWSDACFIARWLKLCTVAMYVYSCPSNGVNRFEVTW